MSFGGEVLGALINSQQQVNVKKKLSIHCSELDLSNSSSSITRFISWVTSGWNATVKPIQQLLLAFGMVFGFIDGYSCARRRRRALVITETEEKLMAAAAIMGLSKIPNQG
jgi:ribose/xylose/arabinose/galactoside ABC-type transport system permease subunit